MEKQSVRSLAQWLSYQESLHPSTIDMGLERVRIVAERLAVLNSAAVVITVAGTNGKGSTVAIYEAIFLAAGYRVGAYTSPHLISYNERVRINGQNVTDEALCAAFEHIEQARGDISLTYFEYGTLAALWLFQQTQTLDVILLEVGLGGRLDAVNVVDADLAMITTIDLDHMEWLGNDRESIGYEKSGVMRPDRPVVCGDLSPPDSVLNHAEKIGADLYLQGRDYQFQRKQNDWVWTSGTAQRAGLPHPRLKGDFQYVNCANVLMGLELLKDRLPVSQAEVRRGLMSAELAGRFQVLSTQPMLIVDVAHNAQGASELAKTLSSQFCHGKTYAVFSLLKDKDTLAVLRTVSGVIDAWHVAGLPGVMRGSTGEEMYQRMSMLGLELAPMTVHHDVMSAVNAVMKLATPEDRVVVFGSFYTVAAVLESDYNGGGRYLGDHDG